MSLETNSFEFGGFLLDTKEKVLWRDGKPVSITPKTYGLLLALVENHGRIVEKNELMNAVWADSFVEESNLAFTVGLLRKNLGDNRRQPRFIETIQGRGYRFVAEVKKVSDPAPPIVQSKKPDPATAPQKPYFLIVTGIILLAFLFGIAFVWFGGDKFYPSKQLKYSRLTTSGKLTNAAASPDGNYLVFAQKEGIGESLWVRQMTTGNQTQILPPQDAEFIGLTVSPDNYYVYYSVFTQNEAVLTLSRVPLFGGSPQKLPDIASDVSVSFSPDGKKFAFTESHSSIKETQLKTADADGLNQKILITTKSGGRMFPVFRASPVAWSPDGETIACAIQETDENGSFYKILLINPNDGSENELSEKHWSNVENIAWKDPENLVIIDGELGSPVNHLWEISRKTGQLRQLTNDLNSYQWLSSAGGNLFTVQKNVFSSLLVADFTQTTKTLQSKQIFSESGVIENVAWSLDGKLYYNSWASGKNEIWQINVDGTVPQQLTTDSNLIYSFAVSPVDNTLVFSTPKTGRLVLSAADSNGQNIRPLTEGIFDLSPSFAADGKTVVFQRGSGLPTLWRVALEGSEPPTQLTGYLASHPALSPDGQQIAYHFMDYGGENPHWKLGLINSENRRLLNKFDFPIPISERKTVWYPKNNLLTMTFTSGKNVGILFLSAIDGKSQTIDNIASGKITSFDWTPDGNRFAFSQNFETTDVISLGGF